jgi:hypothetical protein
MVQDKGAGVDRPVAAKVPDQTSSFRDNWGVARIAARRTAWSR